MPRTQNCSQRHVLFEEINRGNPAQIFGIPPLLREANARLAMPCNSAIQIPMRASPVYVPENLAVIGTMNIADLTLALVDMAFRRRFAFINLRPRNLQVRRRSVAEAIEQRLTKLNAAIASDSRLGKCRNRP